MATELWGARPPEFGKRVLSPVIGVVIGVFVTVLALVGAAILYLAGNKLGIRLIGAIFDPFDLRVYYNSARWVIEGGRLYREVPSVYPLLANIIFAIFRYLSHLLHLGVIGFYSLWIASAWLVYLYALYRVATGTTMLAILGWLAPASIYFALSRYDIYPAVATLMSLLAIRRTAYMEGAIWLGLAVALKGYALFPLPAYCAYIVYQRGFAAAIKVGAVVVAPTIISLVVTFAFAGWEGVIAPFEFHALRTLNGKSTYDAINYLFGAAVISDGSEIRWAGQFLQIGCALAAAAMRPRSFEDLINAFLFAVLGFMSFSVFYSPQYVLWVLPLVCFSSSRVVLISAILFSWLTYLYFPISVGLRKTLGAGAFKAMVVAVGMLRLFMMLLTVKERHRLSE